MRDFWQYLWSPGNHNKLEDRSFTKKTCAWTWIWTRDLLHVKPACYRSATVTWYMEVSKVGFLNSLKISRWPLFLSEINNSHTYLEITLVCFKSVSDIELVLLLPISNKWICSWKLNLNWWCKLKWFGFIVIPLLLLQVMWLATCLSNENQKQNCHRAITIGLSCAHHIVQHFWNMFNWNDVRMLMY